MQIHCKGRKTTTYIDDFEIPFYDSDYSDKETSSEKKAFMINNIYYLMMELKHYHMGVKILIKCFVQSKSKVLLRLALIP